jgi:hypothetical protein
MKEYMVTMWESSDQDCLREPLQQKKKLSNGQ